VIGAGRGGGWVQFAPSYDPNVIWISLDGASGRFRGFELMQDGDSSPRVVAGAAIFLGANPERNATWSDSLLAQLSQHSLALPNLGGGINQQLGSAVLTNTEGGSSGCRFSRSRRATLRSQARLCVGQSTYCTQPEIVRKVADSAHNIVNIY
jgi:hypothetical protein